MADGCDICNKDSTKLERDESKTNMKGMGFDKYLVFRNIRYLAAKFNVKIGEIEREAGCQPGYMSRHDKPQSTGEPSLNFLITAARMLGVDLDSLCFRDLSAMSSTEKYLLPFLEKLKEDTRDGKLDWSKRTAESLNNMEIDENGKPSHPLFEERTYYENDDPEYPQEVTRVLFPSDSFDVNTAIGGPCYALNMKNGAGLYLMDVHKNVYRATDTNISAKEIWMFKPGEKAQFMISDRSSLQLSGLVDELFEVIFEYMQHPKINESLRKVIDAFMNDDN